MALAINFGIVGGVDRVTFNETTGAYHVTTNPTGWGAPNPVVGDATSVKLFVGVPGNTSMIELDLSANFPEDDDSVDLDILATTLGLNHIPSGVWKFTYEVVATTTYTKTKYYFLDQHAQQWFDVQLEGMNLATLADPSSLVTAAPRNAFTNEFLFIANMYVLFKLACRAAANNHVDSAQCIMNFINAQINLC